MPINATGTFEVKSWDEQPYSENEGQPKLTRADVVFAYHGDFEGEGSVTYLMCYADDTIAYFLGQERMTGNLGRRSGSFVVQHTGTYNAGAVKDSLTIIPGSATGELSGLGGTGTSGGDGEAVFTLEYDFV
jgi:hypothetical protein